MFTPTERPTVDRLGKCPRAQRGTGYALPSLTPTSLLGSRNGPQDQRRWTNGTDQQKDLPVINNIDFAALNAHIVNRANEALTRNNKTVEDVAEWLELPLNDAQERLNGTTEFYVPEVLCLAYALGELGSEWYASSGLVD